MIGRAATAMLIAASAAAAPAQSPGTIRPTTQPQTDEAAARIPARGYRDQPSAEESRPGRLPSGELYYRIRTPWQEQPIRTPWQR